MTTFKIASWNVNSLRVRLPHVLTWLHDVKPDVLALQETKIPDDDFPYTAFAEVGYTAIASGQKTYNGMAVITRQQPSDIVTAIPGFEDPQRRILGAVINGVRVINIYIPNGESVTSDKYQYKLNWLKNFDLFLQQELNTHASVIVLGDFNIAPEEMDVHDPILWDGKVLFSQPERNAYKDLLKLGFDDLFRVLNPEDNAFSWWDYRMNAYRRNLGLRIDHILASKELAPKCTKCLIDKAPRAWERPSDHAPIIAEFHLA